MPRASWCSRRCRSCSTACARRASASRQAGWHGRGLLRAREGDADEALERGVLVVPAGLDGSLIQATPPLTITDAELDEAFEKLG